MTVLLFFLGSLLGVMVVGFVIFMCAYLWALENFWR
jgi:hypothetical protein